MALALRFRAGLAFDRMRAWLGVPLRCEPCATVPDLEQRTSPYDSLRFAVGARDALLCYSRPTARRRTVFGDLVPYDQLWRTGANEPTVLHLPFSAAIAGIGVQKGKYSLYTIPGQRNWTLIVNRSTRQWGLTRPERGREGHLFPSAYSPSVARAEVGRAEIAREDIPYVEQLSVRAEIQSEDTSVLLLEWETTRVLIPVRALGAGR